MGLPNPGIDQFLEEFSAPKIGVPVILSIFGKNSRDFKILAQKAKGHGFAALELNLSCPNATGLGQEVGGTPSRVRDVTRAVKRVADAPVLVKLTPNTSNIRKLAEGAKAGGADAVVAINTLKAMEIDPYAKCPVLGNVTGGLSGPAIKPVGLRMVYEIYKDGFKTPIIGCGGIMDHKDVISYILAGASAVELGSAVYYHGFGVFKSINENLAKYLKSEGHSSIKDLCGLAHRGP
jgi:dihydroorotate dehydrogenase (NAD+) catalytic subunit